ncbi:hypothetical protein PCI56_05725 [Plesiomonas shigelloides subsp. oncorhynchi]|nr:hypothetical protein [Plesiomonas shigelloides]MDA1379226.1 hypothetical protein [Plesiomonas shigelloides]MDA1379443.1 hypothetical protein [Plesiomonas shigelloides]
MSIRRVENSSNDVDVWFSSEIHAGTTISLGTRKYCALATANYDYNNWRGCRISKSGESWTLAAYSIGNGQATCKAVCF